MELSIDECRLLSGRHGLPTEFIIKEFYVFDVLAKLSAALASDSSMVFKGGTALNKTYFQPGIQRFSQDLDYDFIEKQSLKTLKEKARKVAGEAGLSEYYEVTEFSRIRDSVQFYCVFKSPLEKRDHVRVDIAAKKRSKTLSPPAFQTAVSSFTRQSVAGVRVYALDDLIARKLSALAERCEGKDVYDVANGLSLAKHLKRATEAMLWSEESTETTKEFLSRTSQTLRDADHKKMRNLTNPFIPLANRPRDWRQLALDLADKLEAMARKS